LKNTRLAEQTEEKVFIAVPNTFSREWLSKKYHRLILEVLREVAPDVKRIEYIIEKKSAPAPRETKASTGSASASQDEEQPAFEELSINPQTNLNPRYIFQQFVVASFNELAQASAWAVAKSPGKAYNPLLIYGGVGLGKTHLLQAIGNEVDSTGRAKVQYLPAGKLVSSIVASIRNNSIE